MKGYYYCSLATFLNIIKTNEIFLSDPLKMNDNLEIKWYLERMKLSDYKDKIYNNFFDLIRMRAGVDFSYEELVECLDSFGQDNVYICCFSKNSDLLSQWRAYGDNGCGVAIGFDLDKFNIADNISIEEVKYCNSLVIEENETNVEIAADGIGTVLSEKNIRDNKQKIAIVLNEMIPELIKYKNPAFIEEDEVRLVYCEKLLFEEILNKYNAFTEPFETKTLEHDFRLNGNNSIIEYVKMKYDKNAIIDISIGPKCLLTENDIKKMVKQKLEIDIKVNKSKSSYR